MIPFKPEPIEKLKARFPDALLFTWVNTGVELKITPGQSREHVFDFEDGIRLIVSKDNIPQLHDEFIHVSGSVVEGYEFRGSVILSSMEKHYYEIGNGRLIFMGFSPGKMVPHWKVIIE